MAFKFVLLASLVAVASAGLLPVAHHGAIATSHQTSSIQHHAAPLHVAAVHAAPAVYHAQPAYIKQVEHHAPANYEFSYSVHDGHTGDIKSQHETRHGDEVHGQYSLLDSDGHHRTVDYHADHHNGFNAVVRREPTGVKIAQPVAHKIIAQPAHIAHVPVAHATYSHAPVAQVAHIAHAAPLAHHSSSIVHGANLLSHHHY